MNDDVFRHHVVPALSVHAKTMLSMCCKDMAWIDDFEKASVDQVLDWTRRQIAKPQHTHYDLPVRGIHEWHPSLPLVVHTKVVITRFRAPSCSVCLTLARKRTCASNVCVMRSSWDDTDPLLGVYDTHGAIVWESNEYRNVPADVSLARSSDGKTFAEAVAAQLANL